MEPVELAKALSTEKATLVARNHQNALVIAADTFIVLDGHVLGKPHTETEARQMLESLNGKSHRVITGLTILDTDSDRIISRAVETRVHMKKLAPDEIESYIRTGEPLDKAGGYAIQGLGAVLIDNIEGDFFNVIGLPLSALADGLKEFGINILNKGGERDENRRT